MVHYKVDSVSSLSTTITAVSLHDCSVATRRGVCFVDELVTGEVSSDYEIENVEDLWYTEKEYKAFESETLQLAKALQTSSWAKGWLKVYMILRTIKASPRMQAAVNAIPLTLDERTVGLQGRYLAPILLDFKSQRHNLMLHLRMIQKQIKDPAKRTTMLREGSRLYSSAPTLHAILAAHVSAKE
uniref:Uncharacterized protein n=1 Tax=Amphora coffeiformis TaxID=265554 RepID=A0A7S3LFI6_9STRA|mmetsp:Transcript_497/g.891  ORF Transcript_497/g.891 Transcript_497/m.891 type:complete len:185 (+) Transcript_497:180-734(+)|eukprot:scaffold4374_cov165-Amphora_coffeaeformis.AAC.2